VADPGVAFGGGAKSSAEGVRIEAPYAPRGRGVKAKRDVILTTKTVIVQ
jgi:hypothetical protein